MNIISTTNNIRILLLLLEKKIEIKVHLRNIEHNSRKSILEIYFVKIHREIDE